MKKTQLRTLFLLLAIVFGFSTSFIACSDDDDDDDLSSVPAAFTTALIKAYPQAKDINWETDGTYRIAEFRHSGVEYDIWFDNSAAIVMHELDFGINLNSIPNPVVAKKFVEGEYGSWTLDDCKYYKQTSGAFYVFEVENIGAPDTDLYYDTEGNIIKTVNSDAAPEIRPDTPVL